MAQVENTSETHKRGHKTKKWNILKRIGFHIDMTPYVDVIMLLLTFFIMTTTLNQPQVMQINLPKGDDGIVKIPMNNCVIIRVTELGNIGISKGREDGTEEQPVKVSYDELRNYLEKYGRENTDLTMILKFHRNAKYDRMINILDEINRAAIEKRYSFSKIVDEDIRVLSVIDG